MRYSKKQLSMMFHPEQNLDGRRARYNTVFDISVRHGGYKFHAHHYLGVICRNNGRYDIIRKTDRMTLMRNTKNYPNVIFALHKFLRDFVGKELRDIDRVLLEKDRE